MKVTGISTSEPIKGEDLATNVLRQPSRRTVALLRAKLLREGYDADDVMRAIAGGPEAREGYAAVGAVSFLIAPYLEKHGSDDEHVIFWPEDFLLYFGDLAHAAGIDVQRFGRRLDPATKDPEHTVALPFAVLAEIEGIYVEVPGGLTATTVPRAFLVAVASAMIGIASGKAASIEPTLGGAIGGVGALLISILANRYDREDDPEIDWLEELILRKIEEHQRCSLRELAEQTHIHRPLLEKKLRRLVKKNVLRKVSRWSDGRTSYYELVP